LTKPAFLRTELTSDLGDILLAFSLQPKQFKTGLRGYYASRDLEIDGVRYQVQVQLVETGSKKAAQAEDG
jgi:hypothetical protein